MHHSPFGWDLPPGCSNADIDRYFGSPSDDWEPCDLCHGDCKVNRYPLSFWETIKVHILRRPHPQTWCPNCDGEGVVPPIETAEERYQAELERRADAKRDSF